MYTSTTKSFISRKRVKSLPRDILVVTTRGLADWSNDMHVLRLVCMQ